MEAMRFNVAVKFIRLPVPNRVFARTARHPFVLFFSEVTAHAITVTRASNQRHQSPLLVLSARASTEDGVRVGRLALDEPPVPAAAV